VKKQEALHIVKSPLNSYIYGILFGLIVITFFSFRPGLKGEFTNWDDDRYVRDNVLIQHGSFSELMQEYYMGNYHPLTLLSYAAEYKIWGNKPYVYHLNNLILHILNVILVFFIAIRLTRRNLLASAAAAFLFALHPMHVESVTWISERKDVLYALFFFSAWYVWILFREKESLVKYAFVLAFFILSCLAKGMAVTFFGVVLVTDLFLRGKLYIKDIKWYIPLVSISLVFGVVAVLAQKAAGFIYLETQWNQIEKLVLAGYAWLFYLWKMIVPLKLSAFYPFPEKSAGILPPAYWLAPLCVAGLLWLSWKYRHKHPWFFFALGSYSVMIVIVLQILSVGEAFAADRYFYVSSAGICIALGVGISWLYKTGSKKNPVLKPATAIVATLVGISLSVLTYKQTQIWKDSLSLWTDTLQKYDRVPIAHYNLGVTYGLEQQDYDRAEPHFLRAIAIRPGYPQALYNLAIIQSNRGKYEESNTRFRELLRVNSEYPLAYSGIGYNLEKLGKYEEAAFMYLLETQRSKDNYNVWLGLGINYGKSGKLDSSLIALNKAAALEPNKPEPWVNMGVFHFNAGKLTQALPFYSRALEIKAGHPEALFNMGSALLNLGKTDSAEWAFRKALEVNPGMMEVYINLGNIASARGNTNQQIEAYQQAARLGHEGAKSWLNQRNIKW